MSEKISQKENNVERITDFYEAAYLLSADVPMEKIERVNNKNVYVFNDKAFVKQELELFSDELKEFSQGINKLRKLNKDFYRSRSNAEVKSKPDIPVAETVVEAEPEILNPIED